MTLAQGIKEIEKRYPNNKVTMIEFEDGSGNNFNFRLNGKKQSYFIKFAPKQNEFVGSFYEAIKIMEKW